MNSSLKEKLKKLPSAPGVYFHKNAEGEVIYVGKAAVLKNRVRQYFQKTEKDAKTEALVREIADTDWTVVDTEMDALFLESEMIKRYKPKWNILLRDDKTVSYVRIDMKEEIPTVTLTRTPEGDGATYIGPFYAKSTVIEALRILRRVFPYYDKPYTGKKTLYTDLGLTPGIEIGKMTPTEYKRSLRNLIRYLNGDKEKLMKDLEREMKAAAGAQDFERATRLRNELYGLRGLKKKIVFSNKEFLDISSDRALEELKVLLKLQHPPKRIEGYDISHISGENVVGSMVVFTNGVADRAQYRKFKLRKQQNNDTESLKEVLERRLKHAEWAYPEVILLDGGKPQMAAAEEVLARFAEGEREGTLAGTGFPDIKVIARDKSGDHAKNAEVKIVLPGGEIRELAGDSHIAKLIARIDEESHRFAISYHRLLQSKKLLK